MEEETEKLRQEEAEGEARKVADILEMRIRSTEGVGPDQGKNGASGKTPVPLC